MPNQVATSETQSVQFEDAGWSPRMTIAVIQPYFLPYIGYYQLMAAAERFVLLDDVNYINRGWINRNRIALDGAIRWLTIPLQKASQNRQIREIDIQADASWKEAMLNTVRHAYRKAPQFEVGFGLFQRVLDCNETNLAAFLCHSLYVVKDWLGLTTTIAPTSSVYEKQGLKGQERILDICRRERADVYLNPPGGRELYDRDLFRADGIELHFVQPQFDRLTLRHSGEAGPVLSILDLAMHNNREQICGALTSYQLD